MLELLKAAYEIRHRLHDKRLLVTDVQYDNRVAFAREFTGFLFFLLN